MTLDHWLTALVPQNAFATKRIPRAARQDNACAKMDGRANNVMFLRAHFSPVETLPTHRHGLFAAQSMSKNATLWLLFLWAAINCSIRPLRFSRHFIQEGSRSASVCRNVICACRFRIFGSIPVALALAASWRPHCQVAANNLWRWDHLAGMETLQTWKRDALKRVRSTARGQLLEAAERTMVRVNAIKREDSTVLDVSIGAVASARQEMEIAMHSREFAFAPVALRGPNVKPKAI